MYKNIELLAARYRMPVAIIDTETTGLGDPNTINIVDIAALIIHENGMRETIETLINPGRPIPYHATNVHGIDNKMVYGAPRFSVVAKRFNDLFKTCLISGFNSESYDTPIIRCRIAECLGTDAALANHLDARMIWTQGNIRGKGKLHEVAALHDITVTQSHRAMADVLTAAAILDRLIEINGLNAVCKYYSPAPAQEPIPVPMESISQRPKRAQFFVPRLANKNKE